VNICYHPKNKIILIGAGIVGSFLTTKGDTLGLYETPNTGIVQVNSNNHFSILHQYSDGSSLEVFTSLNKSIDIMKMLDKDYPVDFDGYTVKTSIPVFQSWDVSEEGKVITLDHSKAISLFAKDGEYIKDLQKSVEADFVFFVNAKTIGYYSLATKKITFQVIE
jgi:hypothetical protein